MRNTKIIIKQLKLMRKFYERLGWKEKVKEIDELAKDALIIN